jgi:hypothetical protein
VIKQPAVEVDQWPPSSAEFKNEWSCTSPPLTCLCDLNRKFTLFYLLFRGIRDCAVGAVTRLQAGQCGFQIPAGLGVFFSS